MNARDIFQDTSKLAHLDPEAYNKAMDRYFEASLEAFPDLRWFEYSAESRNFVPISTPRSQPGKLLNGKALRTFQFWSDARGAYTTSAEP